MNSRYRLHIVAFVLVSMSCLLACAQPALTAQNEAGVSGYRIINSYPHDPSAFTQGLIYLDGFLYESTGLYGHSTLRKVNLETGQIVQKHALEQAYFAEGLTNWGDQLVQLTWQSNVAFAYDLFSFKQEKVFNYLGAGWGLTHDQNGFILSDGSATLRFIEPGTFRETGRLVVTDAGVPIKGLNELEFVRGEIYANILNSDQIARISPETGQVIGWIDLKGLKSADSRFEYLSVLNGIAYDPVNNRLFVTGKLWPKLFEIEVIR